MQPTTTATPQTGTGHVPPGEGTGALDCLAGRTDCGTYTPHGTRPGLRGPMTWSINWGRFGGREFQRTFGRHFG